MVHVQTAAAVLGLGCGPEPALGAKTAAQVPAQLVLLLSQVDGVGRVGDAPRHVVLQPGLDLLAELFLLLGVAGFEVHGGPPGDVAVSV